MPGHDEKLVGDAVTVEAVIDDVVETVDDTEVPEAELELADTELPEDDVETVEEPKLEALELKVLEPRLLLDPESLLELVELTPEFSTRWMKMVPTPLLTNVPGSSLK